MHNGQSAARFPFVWKKVQRLSRKGVGHAAQAKRFLPKEHDIVCYLYSESASILSSKVQELCRLIPALGNEVVWDTRKEKGTKTSSTRDSVVYTFRNGSQLENIALTEKTRGRRFQSGLIEEAAMIEDATLLNEVVLPEKCGA